MGAEEWRPVPGFEGRYEVSDAGRVRSLDRMCVGRDGRSELHRGRVLKPQRLKNGYFEVSLMAPGQKRHWTVHSVVAAAFLGPRPTGHDVLHRDGNRGNNTASNLTYGTRSDNLRDCYSYGGRKGNGKLFRDDVLEIKRRLAAGDSCGAIAKDYGVNSAAIYHIRNGTAFSYINEEELT